MAANSDFDYIVVGIGGIGSAALYWLSKNAPGKKVLGIEQFELCHVRGGSQDVSRIIRMLYHEEHFAKLAPESYKAWSTVEKESGIQLVYKTGGLYWTTPDTGEFPTINAVHESMISAGTRCNVLSGKEMMERWPQFTIPANSKGIYDPEAGLVDAGMGNSTHQQLAECRGATLLQHCKVIGLENRGPEDIVVHTDKGDYSCKKVIVSAGAWINDVLNSVGVNIPVLVTQENVSYFATPYPKYFTKEKFPIFIYPGGNYHLYALPIHGIGGFKIGFDVGGNEVTGDTRNFTPDPMREKKCKAFLQKYLPKAVGRVLQTKTCLYTMTLDRTFLIDTLATRGNPDIIVCCGAGHAYKFASIFGKILSELAISGATGYDISQFCLERLAITDPSFKPRLLACAESVAASKASKL